MTITIEPRHPITVDIDYNRVPATVRRILESLPEDDLYMLLRHAGIQPHKTRPGKVIQLTVAVGIPI